MSTLPPCNTSWPLNWVLPATRSISERSWLNSFCRACRSASLRVPLADCTASSRMRMAMSPWLDMAASATCPMLVP